MGRVGAVGTSSCVLLGASSPATEASGRPARQPVGPDALPTSPSPLGQLRAGGMAPGPPSLPSPCTGSEPQPQTLFRNLPATPFRPLTVPSQRGSPVCGPPGRPGESLGPHPVNQAATSGPARPPGPSVAVQRSHLPPEPGVSGRSRKDKLGCVSAELSAEGNICLPAADDGGPFSPPPPPSSCRQRLPVLYFLTQLALSSC